MKRGTPVPVERIYRHPVPVRVFHWLNALCAVLLLMSGFQIFNAYPRLHWGGAGFADTPAVFEITGTGKLEDPTSWIQIGQHRIYSTGVLGIPKQTPYSGVMNWAFPTWTTLPQGVLELGYGRGWHFLCAWLLAANLGWYWAYLLIWRRASRELMPTRQQLRIRAVLRDLYMHLRMQRHTGPESRHYNLLQKIAYLGVLAVILPTQVLAGMTLSNSALAVFPWLLDLFGGRQSARTIHFVGAMTILLFLLIHVLQVFVAGFVNEMRSIVTGYFVIPRRRHER